MKERILPTIVALSVVLATALAGAASLRGF
jgi:hypothetical protein